VKDQPDEERDAKLSSQVLKNHINPEETEAEIAQDKLRKYIAYAKQMRPELKQEAADKIQDFYISMRARGSDEEGGSVPITARQLEALVRISEASARAELSDEVTEEDAERAIGILKYSLEQVGIDPETGEFDADIIESGVTSSERNRLQSVKRIVNEMADNGEVEIEEVLDEAEEEGFERDQAEEVIDRLKRDGELYEPKQGYIQKI
jgi:replicative DNA helicase Mcm